MRKSYFVLGCALLICGSVIFASCIEHNKILGSWKAITPIDMTPELAGASSASFVPAITFEGGKEKSGGEVVFAGSVSVEKRLAPNLSGEILMAAAGESRVDGNWSYDIDDDDDLLIDFDMGSLKIKFDRDDVTFSGAGYMSLTNEQKDSLVTVETEVLARELRSVLKTELIRFSVIEDVEISKDRNTLGFEIKSPKADLRFRRMDK